MEMEVAFQWVVLWCAEVRIGLRCILGYPRGRVDRSDLGKVEEEVMCPTSEHLTTTNIEETHQTFVLDSVDEKTVHQKCAYLVHLNPYIEMYLDGYDALTKPCFTSSDEEEVERRGCDLLVPCIPSFTEKWSRGLLDGRRDIEDEGKSSISLKSRYVKHTR